jgi:two-component system, cell cycle sensor histidine kinase and response regulator CckA
MQGINGPCPQFVRVVSRMNKSRPSVYAAQLRKIFAIVSAATAILIVSELSTWVIHDNAAVWLIRTIRISLELFFAALLSFTILKKERYFQSNLLKEMEEREFAQDQMRLAMETARIGYWDWDVVKDKQIWSDICKALLGLPVGSEASFEVLMKRVHPDDRERMRNAIDGAIKEKKAYAGDFRVIWPDGTVHWQSARGRAFYDEMGRTTRMIGVSMDIEEQKSAEDRLRLQAAALEAPANAIVITGAGGNILWVNQAFSNLTGYTKEESIGQNPRMLKSLEHDKSFYDNLWKTIQSGQVWRGELKNKRKDGSLYTEQMTITPVHSPSGEINFVGIKQDVTENKRLEAQYRQAQKMEAVGRLAGGVAHDFNNILGVIMGYSEISLGELEPSHPLAKNFLKIKVASGRAALLIQQLLTFSRQQVVYPRAINLNKVIENVSEMLRRAVGEDVTTTIRPAMSLGTVQADVGQLEQVLMNLVVNARDAMPDGGRITIETGNVELDENYQREHEPVQPGPYVMLSVADTGVGMDETTKARLFEPFYTTKEPGKGTGLGLSTVYGIVKQSSGYIWAYSEAGIGTTFKIYLPRIDVPAEVIARSEQKVRPRGGSETILLVEDDKAFRELLRLSLQNAGYEVLEADAPEKALEVAQNNKGAVHLVLSDMVMPQTNGVELIRMLKTLHPELRAILMSGYAAEVLARYGPVPLDTPLIEKPFTLDSLLSKIRAVLDE